MSNPFGLTDADMKTITAVLGRYPAVETALIFGSRAKGAFRRGSDVDIALKGSALTYRTVAEINDFLNEETIMPYRFDILAYHAIDNPDLIDHIDRVGIVFYTAPTPISQSPNPPIALPATP